MKKTLLALATVALALPLFGSTTKAASWHRGTPTALRGYWKSYNRSLHHTFTYKITKSSAYATGFDPDYIKSTRYKYLGHHYYVINGYEPLYSKKRTNRYFKWFNSHHMANSGVKGKYDRYWGNYYK